MRSSDVLGSIQLESKIDSELKKELWSSMPPSIRKIVSRLRENSLWMEIGRILLNTPAHERIDRLEITRSLHGYIRDNRISYEYLNKQLDILEEKGYLLNSPHSSPDYYASPEFGDAVMVADMIQGKIGCIPSSR